MLLTLTLLLLATDQPTRTAEPAKEKMICKRETPIGSLIASRKVCLTESQWVRRIEDGNEAARRAAYDNMGRPSCTGGGC